MIKTNFKCKIIAIIDQTLLRVSVFLHSSLCFLFQGNSKNILFFLFDTYSGIEPCSDVIVSAAARLSILEGGGGVPPVQKKIGGDAALAAKKCFFKDSQKNFVLSSKFSDDLFIHQKLQEKK